MEEETRELKCVYCRKGCGQKTHDVMLPFLGHFVCSDCFEKKGEVIRKIPPMKYGES